MKNNIILAITGPAGSGKSTLGERLAKSMPRCVNIDADNIKHMIVSGFYYDRSEPENEDKWGFSQWELAGESIGLLARNFIDHGYDVVINGYIDEPGWQRIEQLVHITHKFLLLPKLESVIKRDAGRRKDIQQGEKTIARHHEYFANDSFFKDFVAIDSSDLSIDDTLVKLKDILQEHHEVV